MLSWRHSVRHCLRAQRSARVACIVARGTSQYRCEPGYCVIGSAHRHRGNCRGALATGHARSDATGNCYGRCRNHSTRAEPTSRNDDASFQKRVLQLCDAIISGTPAKAHDAFFPLLAYAQVKAIADPERDYRLRLLAHFDRDILNYHRRISKRPGPLRCAGATVPDNLARWMKPGSEYNRVAYFRVLRSRLNLTDAAQNTISLEVTSLISWRGQWYVVHLDGFE